MKFEEKVVFAAFNGRVFAIDRRDGAILWRWKVPKGGSFVTVLPDGDQLLVCADGYLWALRAEDGTMLWSQPFKGEGTGIPMLASPRTGGAAGEAQAMLIATAEAERRRRQSAAASSSSTMH